MGLRKAVRSLAGLIAAPWRRLGLRASQAPGAGLGQAKGRVVQVEIDGKQLRLTVGERLDFEPQAAAVLSLALPVIHNTREVSRVVIRGAQEAVSQIAYYYSRQGRLIREEAVPRAVQQIGLERADELLENLKAGGLAPEIAALLEARLARIRAEKSDSQAEPAQLPADARPADETGKEE